MSGWSRLIILGRNASCSMANSAIGMFMLSFDHSLNSSKVFFKTHVESAEKVTIYNFGCFHLSFSV